MKVIPTDLFKMTSRRLRTNAERNRVKLLVDHYTKGVRLSGTDKESGGVYAGRSIRHFHLSEPDTLLLYQVTKDQLILIAVGTHVEFFSTNEASFLESIKDYLAEHSIYYAKIIVESLLSFMTAQEARETGGAALTESAETDYPTFEAEWGEYVADVLASQGEDREVTFEWYDEVRQELEHEFSRRDAMYRTIHVSPGWIEQLRRNRQQPLGVHWSVSQLDWQPSTDTYDQRFTYPSGKTIAVRMTARIPAFQAIDWNGSVASAMATSEDELRVREGAMLELTVISVDGRNQPINLVRPA